MSELSGSDSKRRRRYLWSTYEALEDHYRHPSAFAPRRCRCRACSDNNPVGGPDWTPSSSPDGSAIVETDACTALAACCTADDAGDLYCADTTSECATNFQYELNYGYCSGYSYGGFTVSDVTEPAATSHAESDDAGDDSGVMNDGGSPDADSTDDASTPTDDASPTDDAGDTNPDEAGTPSVDAATGTAPDAG